MAHVMVKPVVQELSGFRPTSRAMSIKQKRTAPRRSRSCEPQFRIRFDTPLRTSNSSTAAESLQMSDSEVEKMLQEKVKLHIIIIKQIFQTLDIFKTGTVTQSEFSKVLQNYCDVPMTQQQLKKLVKKVNAINRDGTVSYTRFLQKFNANGGNSARQDVSKSVGNALCDDDLENQLKSKLLGQFASVVTAMKLFDYNQDGYIQKHELRRILENYCFKMTNSQFEKLWVKYDKGNNGSMLNYMEFMDDLCVEGPRKKEYVPLGRSVAQLTMRDDRQKRPSSVGHAVQKSSTIVPQTEEKNVQQEFRRKFHTNYDAIRRAVTVLDHRAVGFVPMSEFKKIVVSFTVDMSDSLFHSLLERCGVIISHRIHYERFLDFYGEAKTNILWQPEASKAQDGIFTMLRSHVNRNFSSIKDAFLEFDYNKDGKICRSELRRIVEKFAFRLSEEDYAKFMAKIDPQHKGYISYQRFLEIFEQKESVKHGHPWLNEKSRPKDVSPPAVMTLSTVEEILRNKIKDNWQSVSSAFIILDTNKDGFLSQNVLRKLLERYCLPVSDEHFEMLWSLCDENNDGKIAFNEFLNKLGVDIISADLHGHSTKITDESESRERFMKLDQHARLDRGPAKVSIDQALGVLRNYVTQKSSDLRKMFVKFDSNNDGKISQKEFRQVLESLGLSMEDNEFNMLCAEVGFTHGTLLYLNFLKHFQLERSSSAQNVHRTMERRDDNHDSPSYVLFSAKEAEAKLRTKLQRSFSGLREAFYKFDENHDGHITRGEFRRVLKLFMITLNDEEFEKLINRIQFGKGEQLNYKEFLQRFERRENIDGHRWLMGRSNFRAPKEIGYVTAEQADEIIKKKAAQHWEDISKAFRNFDEDGNGVVTKKELRNVLYRYQLALTQDEFDSLWSRYDTDGNGFVDYKEFIGKLGVEFSPGDLHGHSTRIIEESYDTVMQPELKNQLHQTERKHDKFDEKPASSENQRLSTMEVEQRLKEIVVARFYNFVEAFVEADVCRKGCVSRSVLHKIIDEHAFFVSNYQLNQIWNVFPQNDDGTIQYNDFLTSYTNTQDVARGTPELRPRTPQKTNTRFHTRVRSAPPTSDKYSMPYGGFTPPGKISANERLTPPKLIMTPRAKILTPLGHGKEIEKRIKDKVCDKWRELEDSFFERDRENTSLVTLQQFKDVLFDCNIPLTPDEIRIIWRKHDVQNTGSITYMDFMRSFLEDQVQTNEKTLFRSKLQPTRIPYSPGRKTHQLLALVVRLRKQIRNDWRSMRRSFRALDQQGNGTCSPLAFRHVLRKYKIELSEEEFYHVSSYYDKNLNGRIPYNDFIGAHLD